MSYALPYHPPYLVTPVSTHRVDMPLLLPNFISVSKLSPTIMHSDFCRFSLLISFYTMNVFGFPMISAFT